MTIYFSPSQIADRLNVTPETVRRWVRSGTVSAIRLGDRAVRIPDTELERAFGIGADILTLAGRVERELKLHVPDMGKLCAKDGDVWPCHAIAGAAVALDVRVDSVVYE